jgi:hypothetical protein
MARHVLLLLAVIGLVFVLTTASAVNVSTSDQWLLHRVDMIEQLFKDANERSVKLLQFDFRFVVLLG